MGILEKLVEKPDSETKELEYELVRRQIEDIDKKRTNKYRPEFSTD